MLWCAPPLASGRCSKVSHLRAHMAAATTHVCVCVVASGCAARGGDAVPHCTGLCCSNTHLCVCVCCCCGRLLHLPSISCPPNLEDGMLLLCVCCCITPPHLHHTVWYTCRLLSYLHVCVCKQRGQGVHAAAASSKQHAFHTK